MNDSRSDALVFFGATGDLAYKKIFPSLHAMVKRGALDMPVIGVAKSDWNLDQFRARAYDSIDKHGGVDRAAFDKLCRLLHYVGGDYKDPATFTAMRQELGSCSRPAHYLPGDAVLNVTNADVAMTAEYQGRRRMTLTYPMINRSRRVLWVVTGGEKASMLTRFLEGDDSIPAGRICTERALLIADDAAAAKLTAEHTRGT